ncbi:MAG: PQQ-binding-like beta-propeller repeat protein [Thermomicrobiales bacterium]
MTSFNGQIDRRTLLGASALAAAALALPARMALAAQQGEATPAPGPAIPPEATDYATDWPMVQGDYSAHRNAANSAINTSNVSELDVAWRIPLNVSSAYGAITGPPLVLGETIYFQDMQSNVYAINRADGSLIWEKTYDAPSYGPNGIAVGYGMIFGSTGTFKEAFALRADTGEEVWRAKLTNSKNENILMAPTLYDNTLYISTAASYVGGARGILFALDINDGSTLWQWNVATDNLWGKARINSGATIWYPPSVDEDGNIYFGTGNPAPFPGNNGESRPGPNLYSSSMVSLDTVEGSVRWYVQAAPHDVLDHDFQQSPVLVETEINGRPTKLAIGAGKTGTVIAVDADSGRVVWEIKVGEHNEYGDGAPLPATPVTVLPGTYGGVESPMAFANDTLFVPVLNLASKFSETEWDVPTALADATGELLAIDVTNGSTKWAAKLETFTSAAATVAGDVVFTGGLDGVVHAYNVETGDEVWTYQAPAGLNAPLVIAGDMLFIGAGSPYYVNSDNPPTPELQLVALKLGGNESGTPAVLPSLPSGS